MVAEAATFLRESPFDLWPMKSRAPQLEQIVLLARNRWALDNGQPIEPAALAVFGGVTEARIRNMMSGDSSKFTNRSGNIPAKEALKWLEDREEFFDSIWQRRHIVSAPLSGKALDVPLFVPVARDGSVFHPDLERAGSFTVGPKGAETHITDFLAALAELQRMAIPFWRRPNEKDAWGIVRGTHWERHDLETLKRMV
jgi:hypothetical protein